MIHRTIAAALCLAGAALGPASAQSVQDAQRNLFVCMQKAKNMQLEEDKKQAFIDQCVADAEKAQSQRRGPT